MNWRKFKDSISQREYRKRYAIGLFVIACAVFLFFFYMFRVGERKNFPLPVAHDIREGEQTRLVNSILQGNTTENNFAVLEEESVNRNKKAIASLQQQIKNLLEQNGQYKQEIANLKKQANKVIDIQGKTILKLKDRLEQSPGLANTGENSKTQFTPVSKQQNTSSAPFSVAGVQRNSGGSVSSTVSPSQQVSSEEQNMRTPDGMVVFSLNRSKRRGKNIESYIPAGSYAPAVVISGADAAVGIKSSSDPKPVLLRITGKARTAALAGLNPSTIDLRGCLVTGQALGSLSSEKVYIRTMQLSCSFAKGRVSEYKMAGYVAGTGKAGIRGRVISREGDLVEKSFLAGLAGGLGEGASTAFSPTKSLKIAGSTSIVTDDRTRKQKLTDALGVGVGKGFKNAADRISQYFIDRAEMYQPVITLQAGTKVEVVFIQGVNLDETIALKGVEK